VRVAKWRQNLGDDQPTGIAVSDCEFHEMEYGPPCPVCVPINRKGSRFVLTPLEDLTPPFFSARMFKSFVGEGMEGKEEAANPLKAKRKRSIRPYYRQQVTPPAIPA